MPGHTIGLCVPAPLGPLPRCRAQHLLPHNDKLSVHSCLCGSVVPRNPHSSEQQLRTPFPGEYSLGKAQNALLFHECGKTCIQTSAEKMFIRPRGYCPLYTVSKVPYTLNHLFPWQEHYGVPHVTLVSFLNFQAQRNVSPMSAGSMEDAEQVGWWICRRGLDPQASHPTSPDFCFLLQVTEVHYGFWVCLEDPDEHWGHGCLL